MAIAPKVITESEPITEIVKITQPVGTKNVVGAQVNPATEDTLLLIRTAVEIIDNFIAGARGLVTEDNSAAIKAAVEAVNTALQAAGITQVQLAAIVTALETLATKATAPTLYAVTLTNLNTEYSQALPANTKRFSIHLQDYSAFRLAYVTGKVATPTAPYLTIPAGSEITVTLIQPTALTLFFASSAAGKIAEIEAWA